MRVLTAGESHGQYLAGILEGFPKGVKIEAELIDQELKRRAAGTGRGERMSLENDKVIIASGLRNKISLGSPIAVFIKNKDAKIFTQGKDTLVALSVPRPAHADLAGMLKYQDKDARNIWERASARETAIRVCIGSIAKQFLSNFDIRIASFTRSLGDIIYQKAPKSISEILRRTKGSKVSSLGNEEIMIEAIRRAQAEGDTLGGIVEVWIEGVPPGIGSCMHFDRRLDAKLASVLMGIPAIKGVEIGLGFEYAGKRGSKTHDLILYSKKKSFYHQTNNSGGIEAGISTGEPIIIRAAMKPIATLGKPLDSVNIKTKKRQKASIVRSDTCAILACGVIAESVSAIAILESFLEKFSGDSLAEIKANYRNYAKSIRL